MPMSLMKRTENVVYLGDEVDGNGYNYGRSGLREDVYLEVLRLVLGRMVA